MEDKWNTGRRQSFLLLLLLLLLAGCFSQFAVGGKQVYAATGKTRITCTDKSGRYLTYKSGKWYLRDSEGKLLTGFQYLKVASGTKIKTGYYMFDKKGALCTKADFHKVDTVLNGKTFKGTYYFGGEKGSLRTQKAGWVTINNKKYYLSSLGRRYENCWKGGYYLQSNGTIAKNKIVPDGTAVDDQGRKCTIEEYKGNTLKKKLTNMISGYSGTWSVYAKNLKTGAVVSINDTGMYPASTIKAFVMASVFDRINKGKLSYSTSIKSLLQEMITVSDNEAYNELLRRLGSGSLISGTAVVNQYLQKKGYAKTGCHGSLSPSSTSYISDGMRNVTSAKDCGVLLENIYRGTCVSAKYSKAMLNLLLAQTRQWKIPASLPSGVKVANKTGETDTVENDIAIVYGPKADYVICIFSNVGNSSYAISKLQTISRTVYNYWN